MSGAAADGDPRRPLRVVAYAPYPETGPSTRFRLAQFRAPLAERGIGLRIDPFVPEREYPRIYEPGGWLRKLRVLSQGLLRRFRSVGPGGGPDVAIVHRELAPVANGVLLERLEGTGVPLVFDFDDAVFLPPKGGNPLLGLLRRPGRATAALCRAADRVLAGNDYLAGYARRARAADGGPDSPAEDPTVRRIPTVIDTQRFRPGDSREKSGPDGPVVGWIGTHSTASYLSELYPALRRLSERVRFRFRVVSNRPPPDAPSLEIDYRRWRPDREVEHVRGLDVGLYPLEDDRWTRGKCGFKAIQYLACGVPTVAAPVGVLPEIVIPGETGLLARDPDEWVAALERLVADPGLRASMGRRGRAHVEARYSVRAVVGEVEALLRGAARAGRVGERRA